MNIIMLNSPYTEELENMIVTLYESLSEKEKRRYAYVEMSKLPHGGLNYICNLFGCDHKTIYKGRDDFENGETIHTNRIRNPGGGRKKTIDILPELEEKFIEILSNDTAGDPMNEKVKWTSLKIIDIILKLKGFGINVGGKIIKQLLKKHNYVSRKPQKKLSTGESKIRDAQFKKINKLKKNYLDRGEPVLSIDTKKKRS